MTGSSWAGGDFQEPIRSDGGVALCGGCAKAGVCRLGLTTEKLDPEGVARFDLVCPDTYEGGPGVAHGGWTAEVLDEACGHVPLLNHQMSVTGTITIKFLKPVPLGHQLSASAWVDRIDGRKWNISGEIRLASSGAVLGVASGIWVARDKSSHFTDFERWLAEQS
jgi:acyl-coenzyme A thioesterase PaaI-like protein